MGLSGARRFVCGGAARTLLQARDPLRTGVPLELVLDRAHPADAARRAQDPPVLALEDGAREANGPALNGHLDGAHVRADPTDGRAHALSDDLVVRRAGAEIGSKTRQQLLRPVGQVPLEPPQAAASGARGLERLVAREHPAAMTLRRVEEIEERRAEAEAPQQGRPTGVRSGF